MKPAHCKQCERYEALLRVIVASACSEGKKYPHDASLLTVLVYELRSLMIKLPVILISSCISAGLVYYLLSRFK